MGRIRRDPSTGGLSSTEPRQPREVAGSSNLWQALPRTTTSQTLGFSSSDDSDSEDEATLLTSREGVDLLAARRNYRSAQADSRQARERWTEVPHEGESLAYSQALENAMQAEDNVTTAREDVAIARDSLRLAREHQGLRENLGEDGPSSRLNLPRLGLPSFQEVVSTAAADSIPYYEGLLSSGVLRRRGPRLPVLPTSTRALDQASTPAIVPPLPSTHPGYVLHIDEDDDSCPNPGTPDGMVPWSPRNYAPSSGPTISRSGRRGGEAAQEDDDDDSEDDFGGSGSIFPNTMRILDEVELAAASASREGEGQAASSSAMRDDEQETWMNAAHTARERGRRSREDDDEEERARR